MCDFICYLGEFIKKETIEKKIDSFNDYMINSVDEFDKKYTEWLNDFSKFLFELNDYKTTYIINGNKINEINEINDFNEINDLNEINTEKNIDLEFNIIEDDNHSIIWEIIND